MPNIPNLVRAQLANTIEEIGQAMGLLRESATDFENGDTQGATICASDALEIIAELESKYSELASTLAKFSE